MATPATKQKIVALYRFLARSHSKSTSVTRMLTGSIYFQILGTGSFSTPSLAICSDNERVLFDCGDGTQRLCVEQGMKIAKCSRIYLTRTHPQQTGGLGGFLLTRSDLPCSLAQETTVVGPPRTGALIKSFKHFYARQHCLLNIFEVGNEHLPIKTRDGIEISPILIGGGVSQTEEDLKRVKPTIELGRGFQLFESKVHSIQEEEELEYATSYLIKLPERRGKFHPKRALALGITPGKNFGRLTRGEPVFSVKLNRMVTTEECQDEPDARPLGLVLSCPSMQHFYELQRNEQVNTLPALQVVFHLTTKEVFTSDQYSKWILTAFPNAQHVVVGEGLSPNSTVLPSSCKLQIKLNCVHAESFPSCEPTVDDLPALLGGGFHRGTPRSRFHMSPPKQVGFDETPCFDAIHRQEEIALARDRLSDFVVEDEEVQAAAAADPRMFSELVFLGTGSAMPSKYRNVTGMFVRGQAHEGGFLLDCGEGSFMQLARVLGSMDLARREVQRLTFCWISHIHADHHLGLLSILAERKNSGTGKPLIVVGPQSLHHFLRDFVDSQSSSMARQQFQSSFVFLDCEALFRDKEFAAPALSELKQLAGLESAVSVPVPHCHKSYGIVLQSLQGWKLVWSGDTEYCKQLVEEGRGCDVLIHEATFEDAKAEEAKEKKHSTLSVALRAAREMNAKTVLLTHFSQRYPKCPPPLTTMQQQQQQQCDAVYAFDLMRFQPQYAKQLCAKSLQIQALFAEEEEEEDEEDVMMDET